MKKLLTLNSDFILELNFHANQIKDEETGKYRTDWVDKEGCTSNGKYSVNNVIMYVPIRDEYGNNTDDIKRIWINKEDIKNLAEKIKEIEATELVSTVGNNNDDLPF